MRKVLLVHISSSGCCNTLVTMLNNGDFGFPYCATLAFSIPAVWCRVFQSRIFQSRVFQSAFSVAPFSAYHGGSAWKPQITTNHRRSIIERWKYYLKVVCVNNIDLQQCFLKASIQWSAVFLRQEYSALRFLDRPVYGCRRSANEC